VEIEEPDCIALLRTIIVRVHKRICYATSEPTMGAEIITDVREKPRGKSFFDRIIFSQEEIEFGDYHHDINHTSRRR
jgi:hypothetical protein